MSTDSSAAPSASCFRPRRLGHVNLWVEDIQRSEQFYNAICGLNVAFTEPALIASFLGTGHTPHDLGLMQTTRGIDRFGKDGSLQLPGSAGLRAGLNHLAWELEHERALVEGVKRLRAYEFSELMTADHQVAHSIYVPDPDGNSNEFYCDTIKDWRSTLHGEMDLITSRWDPDAVEPFSDARYDENPSLDRVERAAIHPYRLTHATLCTRQLPAMERFYTEVAGLRVVERATDGAHEVVYLAPSLDTYTYSLVLVRGTDSRLASFAFELAGASALEEAMVELISRGAQIDMKVDTPWKRSFFLRDCDGIASEYYVRRSGARHLMERGNIPLEAGA